MFVLEDHPNIACSYLNELRNMHTQQDRMRFRHNLERIGELLAYELSKTLVFKPETIKTPLGEHIGQVLADRLVLTTILRAGLPMYNGFLRVFDKAESAFIGAFRGPARKDLSFDIDMGYLTSPSLQDVTLVLIDPMLATGKSLLKTIKALEERGKPNSIHVAAAIASKAGVDHVKQELPNVKLWLGAIDPDLNDHFYIVPGLGDAGDLAFGEKL